MNAEQFKMPDGSYRLPPDYYFNKAGRLVRRRGTVPNCEVDGCQNKAEVLMEIGCYRYDWVIMECDKCLRDVCRDCATESKDGAVECIDCELERIRKAGKGEGVSCDQ